MTHSTGTLYVVATPIGNLEDMTFRAVRVLQEVNAIAAEDTRHTGKLLHHFQITTPQISYHDHNRHSRLPELLQRLQQGQSLAIVTDAGIPGISDPGYELIRACAEADILVVPVPGASAVTTALCAAGLPTDRFVFEGFLPAKEKDRRDRLEQLVAEARTLVFYEAPHRIRQTLATMQQQLGGDRAIVLARELTKMHEEFWRGTIDQAIAHYSDHEPQGEYTLVVAGAVEVRSSLSPSALKSELLLLLQQGLSRSQASRQLAQQTSASRRDIYQLALSIADEELINHSHD